MTYVALIVAALLASQSVNSHELSDADRQQVLNATLQHLEREYVDLEVGRKGAAQVRERMRRKEFALVKDPTTFAEALTKLLREVTGDGHLTVEYSAKPLENVPEATFTAQEMERYYGAHVNHGVEKVERLEDNVGLLELTVFPPSSMGGDTVAAAMNVIAHTDALIIDLRNNGGGSDTVALVASYLFDEQQPLSGIYDRPLDTLKQQHTLSYVHGAKFGATKPVYVLISQRTFSAAEALAYDLQALKRATIVGEPSGGGAHPFEYRRIHSHFVLWSVTQKSLNPITGKNWQGTGVQPDVRCEAAKALEKTLELIKEQRAQ